MRAARLNAGRWALSVLSRLGQRLVTCFLSSQISVLQFASNMLYYAVDAVIGLEGSCQPRYALGRIDSISTHMIVENHATCMLTVAT
jgi:hypothetical protein